VGDGFAPELPPVTGARPRRFSEAISEGDGISVVVQVDDLDRARTAEEEGAEALALRRPLDAVRSATSLPLLWRPHGSPEEARAAEADACVLTVAKIGDEEGELERLYGASLDLGLECAIEVRDEDELQGALELVDPEIFLLSSERATEGDPLERALDLLQDVPAGKLAVAEVAVRSRDEVAELERAGVDAVIVPAGNVAELVGGSAPAV
jgi:indole-3-glycerol phosphate synthase